MILVFYGQLTPMEAKNGGTLPVILVLKTKIIRMHGCGEALHLGTTEQFISLLKVEHFMP